MSKSGLRAITASTINTLTGRAREVTDIKKLSPVMGVMARNLLDLEKRPIFSKALFMRGNVEVWWQVESMSAITTSAVNLVAADIPGWGVDRELPVWKRSLTGLRPGSCDMLLIPTLKEDGTKYTDVTAQFMELKLSRAFFKKVIDPKTGETKFTIVFRSIKSEVEEDIDKMQGGLTPEVQALVHGYDVVPSVVALTGNPADLEGWEEIEKKVQKPVEYFWIRKPGIDSTTQSSIDGLAMLWCTLPPISTAGTELGSKVNTDKTPSNKTLPNTTSGESPKL